MWLVCLEYYFETINVLLAICKQTIDKFEHSYTELITCINWLIVTKNI